eukprot:TRINITY_DN15139_c0_g1_i10.p2 TRINITY_DN15139_c0_g1~~TRINITY_DN15139_c0_g1_i10.p2  ORF type:complete len:188 (+),score=44.58 TRINITY_DN15139_c0_g1_i10:892-1455(+)
MLSKVNEICDKVRLVCKDDTSGFSAASDGRGDVPEPAASTELFDIFSDGLSTIDTVNTADKATQHDGVSVRDGVDACVGSNLLLLPLAVPAVPVATDKLSRHSFTQTTACFRKKPRKHRCNGRAIQTDISGDYTDKVLEVAQTEIAKLQLLVEQAASKQQRVEDKERSLDKMTVHLVKRLEAFEKRQ